MVATMNPYWDALRQIPRGQTRSFMELAAMAGRPGAARAAGRAVASASTSPTLPHHRVVDSQGRARDSLLLVRLRREGARPRTRESIVDWAKRVNAPLIGDYRTRQFAPRTDARTLEWHPDQVEPFAGEAEATARGFTLPGTSPARDEVLPPKRVVPSDRGDLSFSERWAQIDWDEVRRALEHDGGYHLKKLLTPSECASMLNKSHEMKRFERSIDMLPRGYGVGSYHYYREPLPPIAQKLRERLYQELAPAGYPDTLEEFWERCKDSGQTRSSSILIGYGKGGINHPHRDVYGPVFFPFQALIALSKRGRDFTGGEFYLADEDGPRPRQLFKVTEGDVVIFATRDRRPAGRKIPLRHGMTTVTRGKRYGLGLVFHLAE